MKDVTNPTIVSIDVRNDKKVIWINIDGKCELRACQIENLEINPMGIDSEIVDRLKEGISFKNGCPWEAEVYQNIENQGGLSARFAWVNDCERFIYACLEEVKVV